MTSSLLPSDASRGLGRALLVIAMLSSASLLTACGTPAQDSMSTGAIPDDYRTRHPISLAEVEHSLDVPVATGDRRMSVGTRDVIEGFLADYRGRSSGIIRIDFPAGSPNASAAAHLRGEMRALLRSNGISAGRIVETRYPANGDSGAPIRLSFVAMTAMTNACGEWPEDIGETFSNKNYHNFGCATQANLAAQIANPMDLVGPRAMTPIDAVRRSNVIGKYRTGDTSTN